jgi:hypothetical protein
MSEERHKTTFAFTRKANELLTALAAHYGLSRTSLIEMMVREEARKIGRE